MFTALGVVDYYILLLAPSIWNSYHIYCGEDEIMKAVFGCLIANIFVWLYGIIILAWYIYNLANGSNDPATDILFGNFHIVMTSLKAAVAFSYMLSHYLIHEKYQNDESSDDRKLCNLKYSESIPIEDWTPDSPIPYDMAGY